MADEDANRTAAHAEEQLLVVMEAGTGATREQCQAALQAAGGNMGKAILAVRATCKKPDGMKIPGVMFDVMSRMVAPAAVKPSAPRTGGDDAN